MEELYRRFVAQQPKENWFEQRIRSFGMAGSNASSSKITSYSLSTNANYILQHPEVFEI